MKTTSKLTVNQELITVENSNKLYLHVVNMVSKATSSSTIISPKMHAKVINHVNFQYVIRHCIVTNSKFVVKTVRYQIKAFLNHKLPIIDLSQHLLSKIRAPSLNKRLLHSNFELKRWFPIYWEHSTNDSNLNRLNS